METVVIHRCYDDIQAEMIRDLLDQNGISTQVASDIPHSVFPFSMDGLGEVRISVMEDKSVRAKELIDEFLNAADCSFDSLDS